MELRVLEENNRYLVGSDGHIYDTEYDNRKICEWIDNTGYYQCNIYNHDGKKYRRVHTLVAKTYVPNPNNLPQVDHIDGNKLNNVPSNLEYVSNAENTKRGYDNNVYSHNRRSYPIKFYRNGEYISTYKSIRALSDHTGFNRKTLSAIINKGKKNNYKNCGFEYAPEGQLTVEMVSIVGPCKDPLVLITK